MSRFLILATYVWSVIIGAYLLFFTPSGIHVVCIACGSALTSTLGVISIVLGAAGLINSMKSTQTYAKG
ncbi:hypothetical protein ACI6Q2_07465 [Chitinophagaceae bacterium LWZ2-11]